MWTLSGVFDRSVLEVFVNSGMASATMAVFQEERLTRFVVHTEGVPEDVPVYVAIYGLNSVWSGNGSQRVPLDKAENL